MRSLFSIRGCIRPSVHPCMPHQLNFWEIVFLIGTRIKEHREYETMPFKRRFRDKYLADRHDASVLWTPSLVSFVCVFTLISHGDLVWRNQFQCVSNLRYYDACLAIYTVFCNDIISTAVTSIITSSAVSLLLCDQELMMTSEELDQKYGFTDFVPGFRFFLETFCPKLEKKFRWIVLVNCLRWGLIGWLS